MPLLRLGADRRLGENLDLLNPAVTDFLKEAQTALLRTTGDIDGARQIALQTLENLRQVQASALAYFDTFFIFAVVSASLVFVVMLMKRSVAEKGAHVAAE